MRASWRSSPPAAGILAPGPREIFVLEIETQDGLVGMSYLMPLHGGLHTLDSCRIEKAYRHWGHDITDEDHVLEAGLGFTVSRKKPAFLGRDAVLRKQDAGLSRRMVQFRLEDPEPLLFHNEAVVRDGKIVGPVTSGNYGHFLGGAVGMGYVPCAGQSEAEVLGSTYEIEVAGVRHRAVASLVPMHDPKSERVRG